MQPLPGPNIGPVQPIVKRHLPVNFGNHFLDLQSRRQRLSEMKVHAAFVTHDPLRNRSHILKFRFDITLPRRQLGGFKPITGVELISYDQRNDIKLGQDGFG